MRPIGFYGKSKMQGAVSNIDFMLGQCQWLRQVRFAFVVVEKVLEMNVIFALGWKELILHLERHV